jgi:putative copper resistance protein D
VNPAIERALVAWPLLTSEVVIFGTAAFAFVIAPAQARERGGLQETFAPWWRWLSLAILVLSPLGLLVETSAMAGVPLAKTFPLLGEVMSETHVGQMWTWRLCVAVPLVVAAWLPARQPGRTTAVFCIAAGLLMLGSLAGHAIDHGAAAVAIYFLHLAAAGIWLGGLSGLCLGFWRGKLGDRWVESTAPRVSRAAGLSVAVLALTGLYNAYGTLGFHLDDLLYSNYGRTLLIKLWLFGVLLCIGGYNRYRLVPSVKEARARTLLVRSVAIETVLMVVVVGVAAMLANTPPPHPAVLAAVTR